jgi:hypothetical protein
MSNRTPFPFFPVASSQATGTGVGASRRPLPTFFQEGKR